ncbi:MAG TPA: glycosyltransferase [Candidatus Angelobacter sp.]|jgi:hopene-associated glycosyltransferase HpnB|nr:glycosyltransferase [Candidatus Angelobacter sp.]
MLIAAGVLALLIWIYLVFARGGFWRIYPALPSLHLPEDASYGSSIGERRVRIAVIIPARNEADVVDRVVRSLLRQTGQNTIHIFLIDDGSADSTAQVARAAAMAVGRPQDLTVVRGTPLPSGWSGKLWALEQGIELARLTNPDFFLFTDADIEHAPDSAATLVSIAEARPYDMTSFMVKLHCQSVAEKLLIPAFVYFFFKLYPPAWIANPRRRTAGAAGGCILIRPAALVQAGGIQAIRQQVIDDCSLAARVKQAGGRLWLGASATTRSIRPYGSFSEIGRMISRSAFSQLRHSPLLLLLSTMGMAATYLLPPALVLGLRSGVLSGHHAGAAGLVVGTPAAAWLLMIVSYIPVLRLYRLSPLWALALPAAAVFYIGATFHSAVKYWSGRGGQWKGRIQDPVQSRPS